jgi:hypothetical protein
MNETLIDLSIKYGTDKSPKEHNYIEFYQQWLENRHVNSLLEVGFGAGASVKMWSEYLKDADIYCIEYADEEYNKIWNNPNLNVDGLNLIIGDSTKKETWDKLPDYLDIIIDDGDHHPQSQIDTFLFGFQHLDSNGLYFIEDTHCSFEEKYGNTDMIYQWLFDLIIKQQTPSRHFGGNFYNARPFIEEIAKDIYSYHIYKSIIMFEKA